MMAFVSALSAKPLIIAKRAIESAYSVIKTRYLSESLRFKFESSRDFDDLLKRTATLLSISANLKLCAEILIC